MDVAGPLCSVIMGVVGVGAAEKAGPAVATGPPEGAGGLAF